MVTLETDLRLHFDQIGARFHSMCMERQEIIEGMMQEAINKFDFQSLIDDAVHTKLRHAIEKAIDDIDISESIKSMLWAELERRLNLGDEVSEE